MKLLLLITAFTFQVSAAVLGQQVTISVKDAPLKDVMQSIRKQTGYYFFFQSDYLKNAKPVTVDLKQSPIDNALQTIFKDQPFIYEVDGKMITLRPKPVSTINKVVDFFTVITIRGKVVDEQGKPLPGASIKASGKTTVANSEGNFELEGIDEQSYLNISYLGYRTVTIQATSNFITVVLTINSAELEEVVINKGYYNTTKELNTGNVSELKSAAIARQPVIDVLATLQGQIPGLNIQQTSGAPGRAFTVRLRGQNSLSNGNDPLYIIDGVPFNSSPLFGLGVTLGVGTASSPLADISPADIESIQVLKDADATAIYGSRGSNGVIIISTKRGKKGKTKIDVSFSGGVGKVTRKRELLNTEEYLTMRREAFANDNAIPGRTDYDLNGTYPSNKYTDWQKTMIGGSAPIGDAQVAFSGGSDFTTFRLSGNHHKEGTVYPGNFYSRRTSVSTSLNHISGNGKFKIDFTGTYTGGLTKLPGADMAQFIFLAPNAPDVYNNSGDLNFNNTWSNPFVNIIYRNQEQTINLISGTNLTYTIIKGLQVKGNFGFNSVNLDRTNITPSSSFNTIGQSADQISTNRRHDFSTNKIKTYIIEPQLSYNTDVGKGSLDVLLGSTYQETNSFILAQSASGFSSDNLLEDLLSASSIRVNQNNKTQYRYNAIYGRIGYTFNEKYIINFTGRRDGSSRFGPGKQFGNFGSVGAAWLFGKERFIKDNLSNLSAGKIRASIGTTGNDKLTDYQYLSTYQSYGYTYQGNNSLYPTQLTNPYFAWEKVNKLEIALDIGILDDRILINTSWYRNRTGNQLVGYSLPDITGFRSIQANLPAVLQNKGVEIESTIRILDGSSFKWTTSLNISIQRSKLVSYPNLSGSSYATRYIVGMPLDVRQYYKFIGVDPETKTFKYLDVNNDGQISNPQDLHPKRVGQDFFGGWTNTLSYKAFQLDILATFAKQTAQNIPFNYIPGFYNNGRGNQPKSILTGDYPQALTQSFTSEAAIPAFLYYSSDAVFSDASYLRIRNVSLSCRIPANRKAIQNCKVYLQCQNLFTITHYKGLDPETARLGQNSIVPPLRVAVFGAQLTF